jgi:hypothetical protein
VDKKFNLLDPLQGFQFLFLLYNFVSHMNTSIGKSKLKHNSNVLERLLSNDLLAFTSRNTNKSKGQNDNGGGNGGQGGAKCQGWG